MRCCHRARSARLLLDSQSLGAQLPQGSRKLRSHYASRVGNLLESSGVFHKTGRPQRSFVRIVPRNALFALHLRTVGNTESGRPTSRPQTAYGKRTGRDRDSFPRKHTDNHNSATAATYSVGIVNDKGRYRQQRSILETALKLLALLIKFPISRIFAKT
jgi:hypothetical protein